LTAQAVPDLKKLRKEAAQFHQQIAKLRQKHDKGLSEIARGAVDRALQKVEAALKGEDASALQDAVRALDAAVETYMAHLRKSAMREYAESIGMAVAVALVLRAFVVEAFIIPSASMDPTLLEGDRLFVNKGSYGVRLPFTTTRVVDFSQPERGDVVVFVFPREEARAHVETLPPMRRGCVDPASLREEKDYIKRVVGVPGDKVKVVNNQLFINEQAVPTQELGRSHTPYGLCPTLTQQRETHGEHIYTSQHCDTFANFGVEEQVVVKPDHVFVMGDNRDNSSDSRCWGQVPISNIKGKAMFIWLSTGPDGVRTERLGRAIE
jgi:signal peptidase I